MYKTKCPKCGDPIQCNTARSTVTCLCGTRVSFDNGECSHGKKKGQCSDPKCEFHK
jgi:hypothetical protein